MHRGSDGQMHMKGDSYQSTKEYALKLIKKSKNLPYGAYIADPSTILGMFHGHHGAWPCDMVEDIPGLPSSGDNATLTKMVRKLRRGKGLKKLFFIHATDGDNFVLLTKKPKRINGINEDSRMLGGEVSVVRLGDQNLRGKVLIFGLDL